jgi:hypothetical protein
VAPPKAPRDADEQIPICTIERKRQSEPAPERPVLRSFVGALFKRARRDYAISDIAGRWRGSIEDDPHSAMSAMVGYNPEKILADPF